MRCNADDVEVPSNKERYDPNPTHKITKIYQSLQSYDEIKLFDELIDQACIVFIYSRPLPFNKLLAFHRKCLDDTECYILNSTWHSNNLLCNRV